MLTPVDRFKNYWVKREDKAGWTSLDYPSGSKVRQYGAMAQPNIPMIVGCASHSAMQIYVAAAAKQTGVPGIIYVSETKTKTDATRYAAEMGAEINEVKPGYMNVVRSRARTRSMQLGKVVKWNVKGAIADAAAQVSNIPDGARSIIVATGSGLTAAGVLSGLANLGRTTAVVAVAVSDLANIENIVNLACLYLGIKPGEAHDLPTLTLIRHGSKYSDHSIARLPDGTPLDPFYAAKALSFVGEDDVLWTPGLRPVRAMPKACREAFADWRGF